MKGIIEKLKEFNSDRQWNRFHTEKNLSMALSIEVAELMNLWKWKFDGEFLEQKEYQNSVDELADIFIYLMIYYYQIGFTENDIKRTVLEKIKKNGSKYIIKD